MKQARHMQMTLLGAAPTPLVMTIRDGFDEGQDETATLGRR